jgi:long-chain acyl-CoA synthetase
MTSVYDAETNHVGGPLPSVEVKLQDIPEMNYTTKSRDTDMNVTPCGEICFRGPTLFSGYYKEPEKTAEAIDEEGWLHSGDVGMVLSNGSIRIIDRKKNIFKLAQGEYVAPEKIEQLLVQMPEIAQVFIYGDSLEAHLIAIIVPAEPQLMAMAHHEGVSGDIASVCSNPKVVERLLNEINTFSRKGGLFGFEIPRAIFLTPTPFTIESDLLTPTMKLKRYDAKLRFQAEITRLYGK